MATRVLRLPELINTVGMSRSTIYALMGAGGFPQRVRLSERTVGWLECDVLDWIDQRVEASKPSPPYLSGSGGK